MIRHTPLVRKIVNGLGILSIVLGSLTIAGLWFYRREQLHKINQKCADRQAHEIPAMDFGGRIYEINRPNKCQTVLVILQRNPVDTLILDLCTCPNSTPLADVATPGDSILKERGSNMITLHRPGEDPRSFDFPCCQ